MSNYDCQDMTGCTWCHSCEGCVNSHHCERCVGCRDCFAIVDGRNLVGYNGSILDVLETRLELLFELIESEVKA